MATRRDARALTEIEADRRNGNLFVRHARRHRLDQVTGYVVYVGTQAGGDPVSYSATGLPPGNGVLLIVNRES